MSKSDSKKLESIQKRTTKLAHDLKSLNYYSRLAALDFTTLETRRIRGDLIQIYKIINGIDKVALTSGIFKEYRYSNRRHNKQIQREKFNNCSIRNSFLLNR